MVEHGKVEAFIAPGGAQPPPPVPARRSTRFALACDAGLRRIRQLDDHGWLYQPIERLIITATCVGLMICDVFLLGVGIWLIAKIEEFRSGYQFTGLAYYETLVLEL